MGPGHCIIITIRRNLKCLNTGIKSFFFVFRGTLATRHKPSGEGLKTQILKRQNFLSKDSSPAPTEELSKVQTKPDKKAKDAKVSLLADLQKMHKKTVKPCNNGEEIPSDRKNASDEINNNNNAKNILHKNDKLSESSDAQDKKEPGNPLLAAIESAKNSKSKPRNIKPKLKLLESGDGPPSVQDQLRLKLEARKKLVDETDEGAETEQ